MHSVCLRLVSWNYLLIQIFLLLFRISLDLLIFCLEGLSIHINGVLKSPTIIVFLLISPFVSVSTCFLYLSANLLGAYTFKCVMSFSLSFYHYILSFFVFLYDFHFKVHIVWYSILLSLLFLSFLFEWNIFLYLLTFSLCPLP